MDVMPGITGKLNYYRTQIACILITLVFVLEYRVCVGIQVPPDQDQDWYCRVCISKKQENDKKKKRKKKDKKDH